MTIANSAIPQSPNASNSSITDSVSNVFDSSISSVFSKATRASSSTPNFDSYSRHFLNERKAIEREKEEWENEILRRKNEILADSLVHYEQMYRSLLGRVIASQSEEALLQRQLEPEVLSAKAEIATLEARVSKLKTFQKYLQRLGVLITQQDVTQNEFIQALNGENWEKALELLVNLVGIVEELTFNDELLNLERSALKMIEDMLMQFQSKLEKRITEQIEALGWPKFVLNEKTAHIVPVLQELLTFGEAIYLLAQRLSLRNEWKHPLTWFIEPIRLRFRFHFTGDRQTNRLDQPEWYFSHLISLARNTIPFIREFLLPCWRLRDLDDFLREGIVNLGEELTKEKTTEIRDSTAAFDRQSLLIHYLTEWGKFRNGLQEEFGFIYDEAMIDDFLNESFLLPSREAFLEAEKERVSQLFQEAFPENESSVEEWKVESTLPGGEPSAPVLKFLSLFHSATILPYSHIPSSQLRGLLLKDVQGQALLEPFLKKCQFDCSPLHSESEHILQDLGMINSLQTFNRILRDDWGESLEYIEMAGDSEIQSVLGYDPSDLPGTVFNRAISAFTELQEKLQAHVFNYVMNSFLKTATLHANSMYYVRSENVSDLPMADSFRLAIQNLRSALQLPRVYLNPQLFARLFKRLLIEKLTAFIFSSLLLKNFFHEAGAERVELDIQFLQSQLKAEGLFDNEPDFNTHDAFTKLYEACALLKLKERDSTAPFDAQRLSKLLQEPTAKATELNRFMEIARLHHLKPSELSQVMASRRHQLQ